MPRANVKSKSEDVNPDYVRMYYEHQYDRINKHEDRALSISNIVLTISALVITFGLNNRQSFGSVFVFFLPVILIVANLFAILYVYVGGKWIHSYRTRAKRILEMHAPELYALDIQTVASRTKYGRRTFQYVIHVMFILIAVILIILFVLEILGMMG